MTRQKATAIFQVKDADCLDHEGGRVVNKKLNSGYRGIVKTDQRGFSGR